MTFTPWQVFVDLGFAAVLLLAGQLLRSNVRIAQRMFLPASVIGGFIGLALGPNGADLLMMSDAFSAYPGILIALIFASLPFAAKPVGFKAVSGRLADLWAFSSTAILLQWGVGILFTTLVLRSVWGELSPGFGALIAAGFVGGHGTAAAMGETFGDLGWPEAGSLAMTAATVGLLSSIVGGMVWVKWGSHRGHAEFVTRFDDLPEALRTGLIEKDSRESVGDETVSSSSVDTLALHFCLISAAALAGYFLSRGSGWLFPEYKLPVFCLAYIAAVVAHKVFRATRMIGYIDRRTMTHLGGALTDVLVVFGIASIKPAILIEYAAPLASLFAVGIVSCCFLFRYLGPRFFRAYWFERSLFTWGWITGVTAMGIALLRVVDPRNDSDALADFGVAYLFIAPVEIGLVALAPQLLMSGHSWTLAGATLVGALLLIAARGRRQPLRRENG
jgi:ESS family glutamate:Na+ symporter